MWRKGGDGSAPAPARSSRSRKKVTQAEKTPVQQTNRWAPRIEPLTRNKHCGIVLLGRTVPPGGCIHGSDTGADDGAFARTTGNAAGTNDSQAAAAGGKPDDRPKRRKRARGLSARRGQILQRTDQGRQ